MRPAIDETRGEITKKLVNKTNVNFDQASIFWSNQTTPNTKVKFASDIKRQKSKEPQIKFKTAAGKTKLVVL